MNIERKKINKQEDKKSNQKKTNFRFETTILENCGIEKKIIRNFPKRKKKQTKPETTLKVIRHIQILETNARHMRTCSYSNKKEKKTRKIVKW